MRRAPLLLGLLLGTTVPMALMAQGVPIIDGSRLSNFISRLVEQAEDAVKQGEKLATRTELSEIEDEQLAAYERFSRMTGVTDLSGFEMGRDLPSCRRGISLRRQARKASGSSVKARRSRR